MKLSEAKEKFEKYLQGNHPDCLIVESSTQEFEKCFAFNYQSKEYINSGLSNDIYVGHGPVLVCKKSGDIYETGSALSTESYVHAFEASGDPFAELTDHISVSGWHVGANKVKATKLIKSVSGMGLKQSKEIIDSALKNKTSVFSTESADKAKEVAEELGKLGFKCRQLWSNQL